jgi:flagellar biosynthetic protein FliR
MQIQADPELFAAFLLALVRASTWILVAPPFATKSIPPQVKIGLAASLAVFAAPQVAAHHPPVDTMPLVVAAVGQAAAGLALGFVALLLFSAVQAAGSLIDVFGGFTVAPAYDPLSAAQTTVFGRLYHLLAITLLFAIDGHLLLVHGFLTSFDAMGPGGNIADVLLHDIGVFLLAAVEIAAPLLGALFLAEVALGLLSRAAPQMNVFVLGFPFKIVLTLLLVGLTLPLLPDAVGNLLQQVMRSGRALSG